MAQWINVLQNNSFKNPTGLPSLCEKTGSIALVQLGNMAKWQAGWHAGSQTDKMLLSLEIFKIIYCSKVQCHYSGTNTF